MSRSDFLELRLQSLAICDFEVAAFRVTKLVNHLLTLVRFMLAALLRLLFRAMLEQESP